MVPFLTLDIKPNFCRILVSSRAFSSGSFVITLQFAAVRQILELAHQLVLF